ncbi:MAG: hypothetical protein FWE24_11175 [Defluviitaleaceae bacterium]|nr:hypothetical protein [Defluviitaleaceae bacterium]
MKSVPELTEAEIAEFRRKGANIDELSNEALVAMALLEKALGGNISAIEYIDKRLGLHPETNLKERKLSLTEKEVNGEDKQADREALREILKAVEETEQNGIGVESEEVNGA